jgi:hypothetical protein
MYSKQEALAHDPMCEQEEQARPTRLLPAAAEGPRIGDAASRTRTVTARDIELFTEITGDRNPLYYDPRLARRSRFGGIVVQGGVTSGLLNAIVAEDLPGPGSVFLRVDWGLPRPGPARRRDHRRSGGHLAPGRQAGYRPVDHDHQPGQRCGSRWHSRGLARPGSREGLSAGSLPTMFQTADLRGCPARCLATVACMTDCADTLADGKA